MGAGYWILLEAAPTAKAWYEDTGQLIGLITFVGGPLVWVINVYIKYQGIFDSSLNNIHNDILKGAAKEFIQLSVAPTPTLREDAFATDESELPAFHGDTDTGEGAYTYRQMFAKLNGGSDGWHTVLLSANTGMGKSTLLFKLFLEHYQKFTTLWHRGFGINNAVVQVFNLQLATDNSEGVFYHIINTPEADKKKTTLLLDGLDEMPGEAPFIERWNKICFYTKDYKGVIVTCRAQHLDKTDFSAITDKDARYISAAEGIDQLAKRRDGAAYKYLSVEPLTLAQIDAYLARAFAHVRLFPFNRIFGSSKKLRKAARESLLDDTSDAMLTLGRPMLLRNIDALVRHKDFNSKKKDVRWILDQLTDAWIKRESPKQLGITHSDHMGSENKQKYNAFRHELKRQCGQIAYQMVQQSELAMSTERLQSLDALQNLSLHNVRKNALLIHTFSSDKARDAWQFAHRAYTEYFAAHYAAQAWREGQPRIAVERDFFEYPIARKVFSSIMHDNDKGSKHAPEMPMTYQTGGDFWMGYTDEDRRVLVEESGEEWVSSVDNLHSDAHPAVERTVLSYWIARTPVTVGQFRLFLNKNPSYITSDQHTYNIDDVILSTGSFFPDEIKSVFGTELS